MRTVVLSQSTAGGSDMSEPASGDEWTTQALMIALGKQVVLIRKSVQFLSFVAFLQLVVIGLWIFGVITIAYDLP